MPALSQYEADKDLARSTRHYVGSMQAAFVSVPKPAKPAKPTRK